METITGLYEYTVCRELGIAVAWSDITDSLKFFTVDANGLFRFAR